AVAVVDAVVEVLDKEIAATPIIGGGKVYPSGALVDTWPGGAVLEDGLVKPRIAVSIGMLLIVSRRRIDDGAMISVIAGDGLGAVGHIVAVYQPLGRYGSEFLIDIPRIKRGKQVIQVVVRRAQIHQYIFGVAPFVEIPGIALFFLTRGNV